jgi:hypothetical protein
MGVDATDVWADIEYKALISLYEQKYGPITFDSIDLYTPLNAKYDRDKIPRKQWNSVAVNARNDHLAELLKNSPDKKILILYGKGHIAGVKRI